MTMQSLMVDFENKKQEPRTISDATDKCDSVLQNVSRISRNRRKIPDLKVTPFLRTAFLRLA